MDALLQQVDARQNIFNRHLNDAGTKRALDLAMAELEQFRTDRQRSRRVIRDSC